MTYNISKCFQNKQIYDFIINNQNSIMESCGTRDAKCVQRFEPFNINEDNYLLIKIKCVSIS